MGSNTDGIIHQSFAILNIFFFFQETRLSKTQQLSQYESQCCTYLPLGMETLNMLEYLSANEPGPFCSPVIEIEDFFDRMNLFFLFIQELVDRLAAVLDFNLYELSGPNSRLLKVKEPSKCCFDPKRLLEKIVELFCNLVRQTKKTFSTIHFDPFFFIGT